MASSAPDFPLLAHFEVCKLCPADFEGFGRGMSCTEPVAKGEEFLAIELAKCWTAEAARSCPDLVYLGEDLLDAVSDASLIALHMLVVKRQGFAAEACRREHIAMLASASFETLMDWGEEDLQLLAGSKWAVVAPACKRDIEDEFAELAEILEDFFATHEIDLAGFLWAHRILLSRAMQFFMEDGSMLYVLGAGQDMFNHSVDVPVGNDDVQLRRSKDTGKQLLVVRACRDYAAGEQAFYSYSDASNGRLLMNAGFVVEENPFDAVELTLTFPVTPATLPFYLQLAEGLDAGLRRPGSAAAEETKAEFLEPLPPDAEQPTEVALHVRLSGRSDLATQFQRILAFCRLQQLCRGGAAPSPAAMAACDADEASQKEAARSLSALLKTMQRGYARSLEEDEAELPRAVAESATGTPGAARRAMALRVLIGEKRIYREALDILARQQ